MGKGHRTHDHARDDEIIHRIRPEDGELIHLFCHLHSSQLGGRWSSLCVP